ncbi:MULTISPECIES: endospore germination permease [unclassified Sutcliffiella]|uniref:GerAB/ArcD/ProY family transporter n=1 Tax=unclassified Sutcliffiella TaxID=2837532 RepID=UPI0030CFED18
MGTKLGLTKTQIFFLIVHTQIGIGMLNLPHKIQGTAKHDGWISILLAGLCIQGILFLYWLLMRRFPNSDFYKITQSVLGIHLGRVCNLAIYVYLIITSAFVLLVATQMIREILLNRTPYWAVGLLIFIMCMYICNSSIHVLARILTVLSVTFLFLFLLSLFPFTLDMDLKNLLPIGSSGVKNIVFGVNDSLISLFGFEIILFLYPLAAEKNKAFLKNISYINLFVVCITVYLTILAMVVFSNKVIAQVKYPVIYIFRPIQLMSLDRIDQLFFSIWSIPMVLSVSVYVFFASKFLKNNRKHRSIPILLTGGLAFVLFLLAEKTDAMIEQYSNIVTIFGFLIIGIVPLVLLVTSILLRIEEKEDTI